MMKRLVALGVLAGMLTLGAADVSAQERGDGRGGVMGLIAGCCFGPRAAGAYNSGKEIHWREWCRLIPYAGIVFAVWDGIEGANGVTTADYAAKYGAMFY